MKQLKSTKKQQELIRKSLDESVDMILNIDESFTKKISSKKNTDLISKPAFVADGVYILHETLGVRGVEGWNPKDNDGVIGILVVEDEHQLVVALEDSPNHLIWSEVEKLVNRPVENEEGAKSDFNGEEYCKKLNSPDFPAAYYCLNYNKGGRDWYLPSTGELWLIYRHIEEIQTALSIVGGQKFVTEFVRGCKDWPSYWSSTESSDTGVWDLGFDDGYLSKWLNKAAQQYRGKVRPVSNFRKNTLKESFTKKISSKKNTDLISKPSFIPNDGVYILHKSLGVKTVDGWDKKFNNGVIGILLIEDDHQIVIALEDSPNLLCWSNEPVLVNQPIGYGKDAVSDFNGEKYCRNLNSPDFPAAYYCLNYKKGNRSWYLPSSGELWMIYQHLEEIQNALSIVGGQEFATTWKDGETPWYWSSTEMPIFDARPNDAWGLSICSGIIYNGYDKVRGKLKVRPVSNFHKNTLKESFTKKISSKKNTDLVPDLNYPDGIYVLHEALGVRGVEGWNPKNNDGVVGVLLVEDEHQLVVALEDSPETFHWSEDWKLINRPVNQLEDAESDFNGEEYCRNLNSPDFPAAYYCLNYKKGGRDWYLPSAGELWLICRHLEEVQTALSIVGGKKFVTEWKEEKDVPWYWSSTEGNEDFAWVSGLSNGITKITWSEKIIYKLKVRPVFNFRKNTLTESFTKKISSKKNTDLISKPSFVLDNGVYILHQTLGVRTVDGWNPEDNEGVVGILLIEDEHKIVVAVENAPEILRWSTKCELINEPIEEEEDAKSDFNGEEHCIKLNSPDFPAAYYCLNYKKGGRSWYLPSTGELWLIYNHLEEIQNALSIVGGQRLQSSLFDVSLPKFFPIYWSSTECADFGAWDLNLLDKHLTRWNNKVIRCRKVRPVSKFGPSTLKESFTRKISRKKNDELISKADTAFEIPEGVYILHQTLGVRTVVGWNPKNNQGVVGILLVEDEHRIVVALEDAPYKLTWSNTRVLVNQPIKRADAASDFNGEYYCRKLNSPDFPAAYYCLNYKKGGRSWYLPSIGELLMIGNHFEEIQSALEVVGGKKFVTSWDEAFPEYWSSTEDNAQKAWESDLHLGDHKYWGDKALCLNNVRPVSAFSV